MILDTRPLMLDIGYLKSDIWFLIHVGRCCTFHIEHRVSRNEYRK